MSNPAAAAPDLPADGVPCLHCGYDLRGLARDARCPECGLPAARERIRNARLRHGPARWLASISWGVRLVAVAFAAHVLLPSVPGAAFALVAPPWRPLAFALALAGSAAVYALGAWLTTRPQAPFAPRGGAARVAARWVAFLPLLSELAAFVPPRRPPPILWLRESAVLFWLSAAALLLLHLRRLAQRVPSVPLARCCAAGASAFGAAAVLVIIDDAAGLTPAAGIEVVAASAGLAGCAAFGVALVWCTITFHWAHHNSRREQWDTQEVC